MNNHDKLEVFVFKVGQGDHILLRLPDGKYGVIDFFYNKSINKPREPPGLTHLKYLQENRRRQSNADPIQLSFIHISHFHKDHITGLEDWIKWIRQENIQVDNIWLPDTLDPKDTALKIRQIIEETDNKSRITVLSKALKRSYAEFALKLKKYPLYPFKYFLEHLKGINIRYIREFDWVFPNPKDKSLKLKAFCIHPSVAIARQFTQSINEKSLKAILCEKDDPAFEQNNISVVLQMQYGSHRLIFGGDAEIAGLEGFINDFPPAQQQQHKINLSSNFIKGFHHGAKKSSSAAIWQAFLDDDIPSIIAFSAGKNKRYKHPNLKTLKEINQHKSETSIYATNIDDLQLQQEKLNHLADEEEIYPLYWKNQSTDKEKKSINQTERSLFTTESFKNPEEAKKYLRLHHKQFLGYHFEFPANDKTVKVRKLMAR